MQLYEKKLKIICALTKRKFIGFWQLLKALLGFLAVQK